MLFLTIFAIAFSSTILPPIPQDNTINTPKPEPPNPDTGTPIFFTCNSGSIDFVGIVSEYKNPSSVEFVINVKDEYRLIMSSDDFTYDKIYGIDVFDMNKNKYYLVGSVISKTYKFVITNFRYIYDYNSQTALDPNQLLINFIYSYNVSEYEIIKKHEFEDIPNASWYI